MDNELKTYLEGMEQRLRDYIDGVERTLRDYIEGVERTLRDYIDERTHDAETRIVRAFGAYQESSGVRMRKIENEARTTG
jgi:intergrase/recombinase